MRRKGQRAAFVELHRRKKGCVQRESCRGVLDREEEHAELFRYLEEISLTKDLCFPAEQLTETHLDAGELFADLRLDLARDKVASLGRVRELERLLETHCWTREGRREGGRKEESDGASLARCACAQVGLFGRFGLRRSGPTRRRAPELASSPSLLSPSQPDLLAPSSTHVAMHLLTAHAEFDLVRLQQFIRRNPLGLFTTAVPHPTIPLLQTSHIPFLLDTPDPAQPGVLRGHIARANPQFKALVEALAESDEYDQEVLILFQEPVHHYITPKSYVETKPSTGKVVPTWDYLAVQAYGKLKVLHRKDDASRGPFLAQQLHDLSTKHEVDQGHTQPWQVSDAPEPYVELLKKAIAGIEITLTRVEGRFKMSQDKKDGDLDGVIETFKAKKTPVGDRMAEMIEEERLRKKEKE